MPEALQPQFLVAEPDEALADTLRDALETAYPGCDVMVSKRGEDAWRVVRNEHRDLAILEVTLQGKSGTWVLQQMRGSGKRQEAGRRVTVTSP